MPHHLLTSRTLKLSLLSGTITGITLSSLLLYRNPSLLSSTTHSLKATAASAAKMSTSTSQKPWPIEPYTPRHTTFPYTPADLTPSDPSSDARFYDSPRFVTHIDDHAIGVLRRYFDEVLPRRGRVLDLCTSWVSHYPEDVEAAVTGQSKHGEGGGGKEELEVYGIGMSAPEMERNPVFLPGRWAVHDCNAQPSISLSKLFPSAPLAQHDTDTKPNDLLTSTTCTVSIDYLTSPHLVLRSLLSQTATDGTCHLVISNRCFPTKAVARWLRIDEEERLQMVGDYLWHAGWRDIEIVTLSDGRLEEEEGQGNGQQGGLGAWMRMMGLRGGGCDPLWVVRGKKVDGEGGGQ